MPNVSGGKEDHQDQGNSCEGVDQIRSAPSGAFLYQETDIITGIFVLIIGAYVVFSTLLRSLFGHSE